MPRCFGSGSTVQRLPANLLQTAQCVPHGSLGFRMFQDSGSPSGKPKSSQEVKAQQDQRSTSSEAQSVKPSVALCSRTCRPRFQHPLYPSPGSQSWNLRCGEMPQRSQDQLPPNRADVRTLGAWEAAQNIRRCLQTRTGVESQGLCV